jgi:thiol-disulfide isomerase/thioredoxin
MKNLLIIMMTAISLGSFGQQAEHKAENQNYRVKVVTFANLDDVIKKHDNKLYVVNFWATWCKPCVSELPDFMEVNRKFKTNPRFKMILVSLDMASEAKTSVRSFLLKNKIDAEVYLLDDNKRMNEWIPAIDKSWTGAIPATVVYLNGKKIDFIEGKLSKEELIKIINNYL